MKRFLALEAVLLSLAILSASAAPPASPDRWTLRLSLEPARHDCNDQRYNPDGRAIHWRLRLSIEPALPTPIRETTDR